MKNKFIIEALISVFLIAILLFFLNPLELMMPQSMHALMIPLLVVGFVGFAAVIWRETPGDEREQLHKFISARFAYFAALTTLIIAVIYESFQKVIDPWLIVTICVILLAKILGIIYGNIKY